jgi:phosphohistidine phosphatase
VGFDLRKSIPFEKAFCCLPSTHDGFPDTKPWEIHMTKRLLIMRHAKSSWSDSDATDHERTLNRRGLRDAPRMGQFIAEQNCLPDLIASSTAKRAKLTAELFVENCAGADDIELQFVDNFYHAAPRSYLEYIASINNDAIQTIMVVGHNPGLETLVYRLSNSYETMPTAAIAHFQLDIDRWSKVNGSLSATLLDVWRPKELDL